jgi:hypothetical protein
LHLVEPCEKKKKKKKKKKQDYKSKKKIFFGTMLFSPWTMLATWLQLRAPQKLQE